MTKPNFKKIVFIGTLIAMTCAAMAYSEKRNSHVPVNLMNKGIITLSGKLMQDKIFTGGDGNATLALTIEADNVADDPSDAPKYVDMVVVLDRSGSMAGDKIAKARQAAIELLSGLSEYDRFGIVSYANRVTVNSPLVRVTDANRSRLIAGINQITAGGGTNLGAGLRQGIDLMTGHHASGYSGRIILISDGLANEGITDPIQLGNMASTAAERTFSISTVGVGTEFNEQLMTSIAEYGTGNYYFMENPSAFAAIFQKEFQDTKHVAATGVKVIVPQSSDIRLINASGYPITEKNGQAVFYPGDMLSGRKRNLFLTFKMLAQSQKTYPIKGIRVEYMYNGYVNTVRFEELLTVSCVNDKTSALASMDKDVWEEKVIQEDYNKLRQDVALDIKNGKPEVAQAKIDAYYSEKQAENEIVKSERVGENLDKGMDELKQYVRSTFSGSAAEVARKQKVNAKSLQYDGYKDRRAKK